MKKMGFSGRMTANLILLGLSIMAYDVMYLATVLYVPFQSAYGLTNTQISNLLAINSGVSILCHLISGWLCDRFSPKRCLVVSVLMSGASALWLSAMPSYDTMKLIFALMVCINFVWAPYIKCMTLLGSHGNSGRVFGTAAMIEAAVSGLMFVIPIALIGDGIGTAENFSRLTLVFAVAVLAEGVLLGLFFDYRSLEATRAKEVREAGTEVSEKKPCEVREAEVEVSRAKENREVGTKVSCVKEVREIASEVSEKKPCDAKETGTAHEPGKRTPAFLKNIATVVRMPETWILLLINLCYYGVMTEMTYISSYLNQVFLFPMAWSTLFIVANRFFVRSAATYLGGSLRDRLGSVGRSMGIACMITLAGFAVLLLLPGQAAYLPAAIAVSVILFFGYFLNANAVNVALAELDPPSGLTGTMIGFYSVCFALVNLVLQSVSGRVLDRYPVRGFRIVMLMACALLALWIVAGRILIRYQRKRREE